MEILQGQKKAIEKNCGGIKYAQDRKCCASKSANICKVRDNGPDEFLECLEENARDCRFSLSFGETSHCLSPVQICIVNNRPN
ncbi:MAG: hypothetical protein ACYSSI_07715 [Planctomycetota bacterium]